MTSRHNALVVFGSGPGIGRNVAKLFAERGFSKVILFSRDASRLKEDAAFVRSAGKEVDVETIAIDLADTGNVESVLGKVDNQLGSTPLEAVLFNAARVGQSKILEFPAEQVEADLKVRGLCSLSMNSPAEDILDLRRQPLHRRPMGPPQTHNLRLNLTLPNRFLPRNKRWSLQEPLSVLLLPGFVQSSAVQPDALSTQGVRAPGRALLFDCGAGDCGG